MSHAPFHSLPTGALIAVVAPAGPASAERVQQVPALIEAQGWRARIYPGCDAALRDAAGQPGCPDYLAASDAQRLADLQAAIADPDVAAVWCLRGGYGSGRLLADLPPDLLRAHPKLIIGYSDITALFAWADRCGQLALHAPMPASDLLLPGRQDDAAALFDLLRGGLRAGACWAPALAPQAWCLPGVARGRLVGGNLSLLAGLCGTPWQVQTAGRLLFIEDVNEDLYRVDRLMLQLQQSGMLAAASGFVLGSFTESDNPLPVLRAFLQPLGKPVLGGWPSGHGTPNRPLPLGALALLDAGAGTLTFEQDVLL
jgi:muramoyltetrapeptide carboxypeptidase